MNVTSLSASKSFAATPAAPTPDSVRTPNNVSTEEAFRDFAGETFFGLMLKSLRSTEGKTAYLSGGQAESMFRGQLDQTIATQLAESHGDRIAKPMYDAFRSRLDARLDTQV